MTIVKVQIPLASNDPDKPALVYDERRKRMSQQQLDADVMRLMGDDKKAFFEAEWAGWHWKLGKRVGFQPW